MAQANALKALIQRLTSTPVEDLPSIAYFLASSISACIKSPQNPGSDRAALLHKLKARISSLLQDRTPEARLAAVIVVKAVIEVGGQEILVDSEPWIRGLIGILNRSDPVATKRLAIITITRAFVLTRDYPSIVRDVTTPLLPSFNTACLAVIRPKTTKSDQGTRNILSPLLLIALQCWNELLPQHPATFRPFVTRFRPICLSLLSDATTSDSISRSAGDLLVALHHSAPKNSAISEWSQFCGDTIRAAHITADSLFRSVREDWVPAESSFTQIADVLRLSGEQPGGSPDVLGLAAWTGMHIGVQRLSRLLGLLEASVSAITATEVPIPLSSVMDLSARLLALTIPGTSKDSPYMLRPNADFGKDEREMLSSEIPTAHFSCLGLLSVVVETLNHASFPITNAIVGQLIWLFDAEHGLPQIRAASYDLLILLLPVMGPASTDTDVKNLSGMISHACKDALPTALAIDTQAGNEKDIKGAVTNVDSFAGPMKQGFDQKGWSQHSDLQNKATNLICMFLQCVPAHLIPNTQRTKIDRTIVLNQDKRALLASVLNPATANQGQYAPASLLPFLAHADSGLEVESLLRPRMAVIVDQNSDAMEHDTTESESGRLIENNESSNTNSLLDRLDKALKAPGPANTENSEIIHSPDTAAAAATLESNTITPGDIGRTATKRDFADMNGNGMDAGQTAAPSTLPVIDNDAKKARIDDHGPNTLSWGDKDLTQAKPSINGHAIVNVRTTDPILTQDTQSATNVQIPANVESQVHPIPKSGLKTMITTNDGEDSDSDIPEINIEPDTDEDDEDDEDMYD